MLAAVTACLLLIAVPDDAATDPTSPPAAGRLRPVAIAQRVETSPVIDGALDDAAWTHAIPITEFRMVEPAEGLPTEATEVRFVHDGTSLFIAVRCFDRDPAAILARQMQRDGDVGSDDHVTIVLDPIGDRRNGYLFRVGAAGGRLDALVEESRTTRVEWDGIWIARTQIDEHGWTAEFEIPFAATAFDPNAAAWGLNVERIIRRRNEVVRWSGTSRNLALQSVVDTGDLIGLDDLTPGLGLTIRPSAVARFDANRGSTRFDPSLDLFYRLTPTTTLALTINTDFAETEVDERQVNLSRFPLFFPEKRDFFLQDAGIFQFGGIRRSPLPFFSRRIGIGSDGRERGILGGVKITGRQRNLGFGVLSVQMDDEDGIGSKNLSVGRALFNVLEESSIGVMATHGDPNRPGDASLFGADANFRFGNVAGNQVIDANAWFQATHTSGSAPNDDPVSFGGRIGWPNDRVSVNIFAAQIGEDYRPSLGFVERTGVREYSASVRSRWRPRGMVRTVDLTVSGNAYTDLSNRIETGGLTLPELRVTTDAGDAVAAGYKLQRERLDEDFLLLGRLRIPEETYDWDRAFASFTTSGNRAFAARGSVETGGFFGGNRTDWTAGLDWRPGPRLQASLEYSVNDIDIDAGDAMVRIARLRVSTVITPDVTWNTLVQYDNESEVVGFNSRLRWEIQPGRNLFLVLNQAFNTIDDRWRTEESQFTAKLGWSVRF